MRSKPLFPKSARVVTSKRRRGTASSVAPPIFAWATPHAPRRLSSSLLQEWISQQERAQPVARSSTPESHAYPMEIDMSSFRQCRTSVPLAPSQPECFFLNSLSNQKHGNSALGPYQATRSLSGTQPLRPQATSALVVRTSQVRHFRCPLHRCQTTAKATNDSQNRHKHRHKRPCSFPTKRSPRPREPVCRQQSRPNHQNHAARSPYKRAHPARIVIIALRVAGLSA